jgi:hypothetical protein
MNLLSMGILDNTNNLLHNPKHRRSRVLAALADIEHLIHLGLHLSLQGD